MKIAFLSRYQQTTNRGAESFVAELSEQLAKKNKVEILCNKDADNLSKIIQGNYQVVFAINGRSQSLRASLGRSWGNYKLVITGQSGIGKDDILNISLAKPDVFVALTDYMRDWARKWAWGSKVVKIPNGVDTNKFKPGKSNLKINLPQPIILSVGALQWYKHHELTIKAVTRLQSASLLIVGTGNQEQQLQEMGQKLLGKRFALAKFPYQQMPDVYRLADLFVLPSWEREAFGIAYIEAMATNLPVVAPDDSPRREIIGTGGIFTNVYDTPIYAQSIERALKQNWQHKPHTQSLKFDWSKIGEQYQQLLDSLV
ncbi:MAG: glycosyltransferase [Patescibacteria group bacterium]|nr:glycosyltransferase [Patescibacteria group bacterium]